MKLSEKINNECIRLLARMDDTVNPISDLDLAIELVALLEKAVKKLKELNE